MAVQDGGWPGPYPALPPLVCLFCPRWPLQRRVSYDYLADDAARPRVGRRVAALEALLVTEGHVLRGLLVVHLL